MSDTLLMETLLLHTCRLYFEDVLDFVLSPVGELNVFIEFEERNKRDISILDI